MTRTLLAATILGLLLAGHVAWADEITVKLPPTTNLATLQGGVTYTEIDNGFARSHLEMDIMKPASSRPTPAIVFVSGNGWRSIDRAALIPQLAPFAKAGYLVATIDYRIIGEAVFPAPLQDVKTAIRFLRANAKTYNIDPDHIGIWGNSAGGHLSGLVAATGDAKAFENDKWPGQSSAVQAAVLWYAPMDLSRQLDNAGTRITAGTSVTSGLMGLNVLDPANAEAVQKANPITYVSATTPPMLLVHGTADTTVSIHDSEAMYAAMMVAHRPVTLITVEGAGHSFGQMSSTPEVTGAMLAFFDKYLKGK